MIKKLLSIAALALCFGACSSSASKGDAQADNNPDIMDTDTTSVKVEVKTTVGDFTVLLYGDTPGHRDNFLSLVNKNFYDSVLFHRVIEDFMVQAGDPDSKNAKPGQMLGGGGNETIPAEIKYPTHYHKRGALAAARMGDQVNPERASSGSQFYVVTGRRVDREQLRDKEIREAFTKLARDNEAKIRQMQDADDRDGLMELQGELIARAEKLVDEGSGTLTQEQIEAYTTVGGAPHLDGAYTVFGEVIDGMDTIEKIEKAETDNNDRPLEDIRIISMKVVK